MKRELIILILLIFSSVISYGQTWSEWFKQKKTQKKYLLEQIAAYQTYLGYAKKGYTIAKDGTKLIGDIKNGDFGIHNEYFKSLKMVNPQIRDANQADDIAVMYQAILKSQVSTIKLVETSTVFSNTEIAAVKRLYAALAKDAEHYFQDFKLLTTDSKLELSDDARILRMGKLFQQMQEQYGFQLQIEAQIKALAESRMVERKNLESLKRIYGF